MKKAKKILLTAGAYLLTAALAIGGTVAYLTSDDSDVNVMTLGNVKIEQIEEQLAEDGVTKEPFEQAKDLYPGTEVSKIVTVKNTGKSDAYFRTLIAFEDIDSETFGIDFPVGEYSGYKWSWVAPEATIVIDGVTYQVYEAVYTEALKAGETSPASLTRVEFATTCTNEDMAKLGNSYEILVISQAVQTAGFEDAKTALDTAFGKTAENAADWFGGVLENTYINEAFSQNYDATQKVVIDGEGKEIFSYVDEESIDWGAGNKPNLANVFTNAEVSNISFTGTMMPVMSGYWDGTCNFNNTFNNVNLVGIESVGKYSLGPNFTSALLIYGNATLNNCNIYSTTTKEDANLYDVVTPTGHTTINGGKIGNFYMANAGTTLTVNGAEVNSIYAAGNKAMIIEIGANSTIGTITLPSKATLTIAEGATVDTIICSGKTYTQAEWLKK